MGTGLGSPWHIAILALVLLLFFGPKRLPEMGRSLGRGMREFKDSLTDSHEHQDEPPVEVDEVTATPGVVSSSRARLRLEPDDNGRCPPPRCVT